MVMSPWPHFLAAHPIYTSYLAVLVQKVPFTSPVATKLAVHFSRGDTNGPYVSQTLV